MKKIRNLSGSLMKQFLDMLGSFYRTHASVPHANSYNMIRLLAAAMVVFSHSFAITGSGEPHVGTTNLGAIGVWIFFILSGYLISASWHQYPRFTVFITKRALRIFPALIVMLIVTAIAGVFFTTLPALEYLTNPSLSSYLNNMFLYQLQFSLPGVFTSNPYPDVVNGSVWTLSYEFTMYLAVGIIGALSLYKRMGIKKMWSALFLVSAIFAFTLGKPPVFILFNQNLQSLLPLMLMFFTGILVQQHIDPKKTKVSIGIMTLIAFLIGCHLFPAFAPLFASTLLAYTVFSFGSRPFAAWQQKYGDFSYGIYIYAFFIQQAVESATHTKNSLKLFLISFVISFAVGALSWHFIESPALKLKRRLKPERYPITQTDEAW